MDVRTLLGCLALVSFCSASLIIAMQWLGFSTHGSVHWARGFGLMATGGALAGLRGSLPDLVSVVLANVAIAFGSLVVLQGVRCFVGRPNLPRAPQGAGLLVLGGLLWYHSAVAPSLAARIVAESAALALVAALTARELLGQDPGPRWSARRLTGLTVAANAGLHLLRVTVTIRGGSLADPFAPAPLTTGIFLGSLTLCILITSGLLLMVAERTQANVAVLSGLLPICSYCRRVRDDTGYWNEIEAYVRAHAGTRFSHGICPTCHGEHVTNQDDPHGTTPR